jgi:hypothetical protein
VFFDNGEFHVSVVDIPLPLTQILTTLNSHRLSSVSKDEDQVLCHFEFWQFSQDESWFLFEYSSEITLADASQEICFSPRLDLTTIGWKVFVFVLDTVTVGENQRRAPRVVDLNS